MLQSLFGFEFSINERTARLIKGIELNFVIFGGVPSLKTLKKIAKFGNVVNLIFGL